MKKFLLLAAAGLVAVGASAVNNKVTNGDFEAQGYEQSIPGGYTWDPWNTQNYLSVLPGWNLSTAGEWNGGVEMKFGDDALGDGDTRPEDDAQYLHFVGYNDNGWAPICVYQEVPVKAGVEYTLDFVFAANCPEGTSWTPDPDYGFKIAEVDHNAEGDLIAGKEIMVVNLGSNPDFGASCQDWTPYSTTFTPNVDKIYLEFYYGNYYSTGNKTDNKWMDLDLVQVYSDADADVAIETVEADNNAAAVYYNLQGVRVNNPAEGLFIKVQGNKATKVAL